MLEEPIGAFSVNNGINDKENLEIKVEGLEHNLYSWIKWSKEKIGRSPSVFSPDNIISRNLELRDIDVRFL